MCLYLQVSVALVLVVLVNSFVVCWVGLCLWRCFVLVVYLSGVASVLALLLILFVLAVLVVLRLLSVGLLFGI